MQQKKVIAKMARRVKADPNYPAWGNSDHLGNLGGVIRIIPAKIYVIFSLIS
jgi:hypothetical protein